MPSSGCSISVEFPFCNNNVIEKSKKLLQMLLVELKVPATKLSLNDADVLNRNYVANHKQCLALKANQHNNRQLEVYYDFL